MSKRTLSIIGGVFILIIIPLFIFLFHNKQTQQLRKSVSTNSQKGHTTHLTYTISDTAFSPNSSNAITHNKIIKETAKTHNATIQKFVVKSTIDNSERELFWTNEPGVTFENITPQNWSPTNRFVYIYVDYPGRRDVIFIKTDGKFTNGQYFLHSTGLYPDMNVLSAKWIDISLLELQTVNNKTKAQQKYLVNFDDDTGIVIPQT